MGDESRAEKATRRAQLIGPVRITHGDGFDLSAHDPASRSGLEKDEGKALAADARDLLRGLQALLAAEGRHAVLLVLQGMDAAGKDGTIKHVMSGVNPQGVVVTSFKQPGPVELAHDFLWRIHQAAPARGRIAIFNRSHYEEVLTCRVHPELLDAQNLPDGPRDDAFWRTRLADIVAFERYLAHQGVVILKFFLHISADEQRRRLLSRLDDPDRNWKFSKSDLAERARWDDYQRAYQDALRGTATEEAPWFVIPADHKWHARLLVTEAVVEALERIDPRPPHLEGEALAAIEAARVALSS